MCVPVVPERRTGRWSAPGCFCQLLPAARVALRPTDTHHTSPRGASPARKDQKSNRFKIAVLTVRRMNREKPFIKVNPGISLNYLWSGGGPGHDLLVHPRTPFTVVLDKQTETVITRNSRCSFYHKCQFQQLKQQQKPPSPSAETFHL